MNNWCSRWITTFTAWTLLTPAAFAQATAARAGPSLYAGVSGGYSDLDIQDSNVTPVGSGSVDDSSHGWKIFAGAMSPRGNWPIRAGIEVSYVDLGEADATIAVPGGISSEASADFQAAGISGLLGFELASKLTCFAKLGWFFGFTDSEPRANSGIALTTFSFDEENGFHMGLAATYALTDRLDFRLDWDRYEIFNFNLYILGPPGEDSDPDFFSAGLQYRF